MILLYYLAIALCVMCVIPFIRFLLGPTLSDRVVAFDVINTMIVVAMLMLGAYTKQIMFFDIATIYAILAFAGTIAIAKYMEGTL